MASATPATARQPHPVVLSSLLVGAGVALALGTYGRAHDPTGRSLFTLFFTSTITLKSWFATVAVVLAVVQVLTALRLYGKLRIPRKSPAWLGDLHRLTGTLAFLFSLPVAYHCLWALGFAADSGQPRRLAHSILGCAFYGAFAAKMLIVRSKDTPAWLLPVVGGTVFLTLVAIWGTSSLWFFQRNGLGL